MTFQLTIPARVNILGNPSDGVEGDFATLSMAANMYAGAQVEAAGAFIFEQTRPAGLPLQSFSLDAFPFSYDGTYDLLKGALNRLHAYSPEFRRKTARQGMHLVVWSDVPRQSGLGGSSLFVLLALAACRELYDLDRRAHNDYVLAELAQRTEAHELGITCGYADRYVPLFGGLAYLDYRGKLAQRELGAEPFVTYERLDNRVEPFSLVAISTGVRHNSGDVHGRMRPIYLSEHAAWQGSGGPPPPMVAWMSAAWETAWRGKQALLAGDHAAFGQLMNENHRLVDEMMRYCGFADGAGWANNLFIQAALENGALGAKLTGAGGGGSVFALVNPGEEAGLMGTWKELAKSRQLKEALVYQLEVCSHGLLVQYG